MRKKRITENQSEMEAELEPEQCSACSGFEQNRITSNCRISKWILGLWAPIGRVYRGALRGFLSKEKLRCWMFLAGCAMVIFIESTMFFLITTFVAVGLQYQGALGPADATMFSAKLMWCNYWTFAAQRPIILEPTPTNQLIIAIDFWNCSLCSVPFPVVLATATQHPASVVTELRLQQPAV